MMPTLHVQLLGEFRLVIGETPVTGVNSPRLQSLLAFLILHRRTPQPRQHLAFQFWPGSTETQARTNLRYLIHALRQALPDPDRWLDVGAATIQWRPDAPFTLDVAEFEAAVTAAHSVATWQHAVSLYSGELLPTCYDDWIQVERDRLAQGYSRSLEQLSLALEEAEDNASALEFGERLMHVEPLREETYRLLMRLHARTGDRLGVSRVYKRCARVLQRELGVEPSLETRRAFERVLQSPIPYGERPPSSKPPIRQPQAKLPVHLTSFVGRVQEKDEVKRAIGAHRLVTLTGVGGLGKTRLAREVAAELGATFEDGVWWVDLAPLSDAALLPEHLLAALELSEQPGCPPMQAVAQHIRDKHLLLILDNCEHVVDAAGDLAMALLQAAPALHILATSRARLRCKGELDWRVPALSFPSAADLPGQVEATMPWHVQTGAASALEFDAIRLFRDRATTTLPTFSLTGDALPLVSRICEQLEGIPLAIELAAARVKLLTLEQIAERLDDYLQFLSAAHTEPSRHQTLQAVMDWSYALLSEKEQRLLRRLAVFSGSFTLQAAEEVCGVNGMTSAPLSIPPEQEADVNSSLRPSEILDLLSSLQDQSLLQVGLEGPEARNRLLELVRQYSLLKLEEQEERDLYRTRHLEFFARMAEQAEPQFYGTEQSQWFERLDREADNLRAALEWAQSGSGGDRVAAGLRLAGSLMWYWYARGHWTEVRSRLTALLGMPEPMHDDALVAKALLASGLIALFQDDRVAAGLALNELRAIAARLGPAQASLLALIQGCGGYALMTENPRAARKMADAASALALRVPGAMGKWLHGFALMPIGRMAQQEGDYGAARAAFDESLELFRQAGGTLFGGVLLGYRSSLAYHEGNYEATKTYLDQALATSRRTGHTRSTAFNLVQLGRLYVYEARYDAAWAVFQEALELWQELGEPSFCAWTQCRLGHVAIRQRAIPEAARIFLATAPSASDFTPRDIHLYWLMGAAALIGLTGNPPQAVRLLSAIQVLAPTEQEELDTWRQTSGEFSRSFCFRVDPLDRAEYEGYLSAARAQLSEQEFAVASEEGSKLTLEKAVASARVELERL